MVVALGGLAGAVQAQTLVETQDMAGLAVDAALDVRSVENAGLQSDSEDQVSETQTVGSLAAEGHLQGAWADFTTNYALEDRRYSEFSEEDEQVLLGDAVLTLGPQHRRYYARLSHSSREVSLDPLAQDLPANRDSRQFFSGVLSGSVRAGQPNLVTLWAGATDIHFDETEENEAVRYSAGLNLDRAISPLHAIGLSFTGYDLQYRYLDNSDLTYKRVAAVWRAELRRLQYEIEIGSNKIENDFRITRSPSARIELNYQIGAQALTASYNQFLSDTSQGSNETVEFQPDVEVDGRLEDAVDQFKIRQFRLAWSHAQICRGCTLEFNVGFDEEEYVTFTEFDSRETIAGTRLAYLASANLLLSLRGTFSEFEEVNSPLNSGYTQTKVDFGVGFPQLMRNGELDLYVGTVDRDSDAQEGYTSSYVGARFQYRLLDL